MLRYTTWGAKSIAWISLALVAMSAFLPYLEFIAFTPLYAFIHRFSITLEIGSFSKTLQPIFFVIPILFIRSLFEFHKRYNIALLPKTPLFKIVLGLTVLDLFSVLTSTNRISSLAALASHLMNYALFSTLSIWVYILGDMIQKTQLRTIGTRIFSIFSITLIAFASVNALVSITQFIDCSTSSIGCNVWKKIDETFPNKLLPVGHQKFSYKPVVIRAPGFFGDVNFNGMFGLYIAMASAFIYATLEILKKEKGYVPEKEQKLSLIGIVAGAISFLLNLSRSAILATGIMGLLIFVIYALPHIKHSGLPTSLKKKLGLFLGSSATLGILLFGLGFAVPLTHNGNKTSVSFEITRYISEMFSPEEDSAQGHADLFVHAITIGRQYPLTGTGIGTFSQKYVELISPSNPNVSPHSTYGLIFAEQGIIGSIGFLAILTYIWKLSLRALVRAREQIAQSVTTTKRATREYIITNMYFLVTAFLALAIPYFSVATITYYGFFLPMVWWWGNRETLSA